jgi:FkbM family methyltransferase
VDFPITGIEKYPLKKVYCNIGENLQMFNLKTIDGYILGISPHSSEIQNYLDDGNNYVGAITHQINDLDYYNRFLDGSEKIILDIGANIGIFSLHVSKTASYVLSVEPTPEHYKILTELTADFKNIHPIQMAISNKTGREVFYKCADNTTMNSLINRGGTSIEVDAITLIDLINSKKLTTVDFLKMDIEGSEIKIITEDLLNQLRPIIKKWFIECHYLENMHYTDMRKHFELLFRKCNYSVVYSQDDVLFCT